MVNAEQASEHRPNRGNFVRFFPEQGGRTEPNNYLTQVQNKPNNEPNRAEQGSQAKPNSRDGYGPRRGPTPGADARARLTGTRAARASQILALLDRIKFSVPTQEATRLVRSALYDHSHDPKEVLAALLAVAAECRGEKTYQGKPLANLAFGTMGDLVEGERRVA